MSRNRDISSDISMDGRVADISAFGFLAVTLYMMAIPQADDWGRLTGDARQFKMLVCPGFDVTVAQVNETLAQIASAGLMLRYEAEGKKVIAFPAEAWFKRQSYINIGKRTSDVKSNYPTNDNFQAYATSQKQAPAEDGKAPSPCRWKMPSVVDGQCFRQSPNIATASRFRMTGGTGGT